MSYTRQIVIGDAIIALPTSDGTAGDALCRSSTGHTYQSIPRVKVAAWQGYTLPANTSKNAAYTYTVAANTLSTSKCIRMKFILRKTAGANNVTIGAEWNGSTMHTAVTVTTLNYEVEVVLYGAGTTTAQRSIVTTQTYTSGTITRTNTVTLYAHDQTVNLNFVLYVTKATGSDTVILDYAEVVELET